MKLKTRLISFLLSLVITVSAVALNTAAAQPPSVSAQSAVLTDADSGAVLFEHNAHERMGMASTTKIMTALTALRLADPQMSVTVPKEAVGIEGSSIYLYEGEQMTLEQLLYALLLASANDAAAAIAIACAGSVEKFADEMNLYAEELGLTDTHFVNPHGLYDENHYTTAYDLAVISRAALQSSLLSRIFSAYKAELPFNGESNRRLVVNHNKLLRTYDGAIGIKTGYTKSTGRCLVSAAERDGLTLICVTLNAPDDWRDHTSLLDYGFENYENYVFADIGEFEYSMPIVGAERGSVTLTNTRPVSFTVKKGSSTNAKYTVEAVCRFLYAPVYQKGVYASLTVELDGIEASSPLAAAETAGTKKPQKSLWQKITEIFKKD